MFSLSESDKFMVCTSAVDLRKGVDPLSRMVRSCSMSPTDGSVYVFMNPNRSLGCYALTSLLFVICNVASRLQWYPIAPSNRQYIC